MERGAAVSGKYSVHKSAGGFDLIRAPSGLVATFYYENRAREAADALNNVETLRAALERVMRAWDDSRREPVEPTPCGIKLATAVSNARAALAKVAP